MKKKSLWLGLAVVGAAGVLFVGPIVFLALFIGAAQPWGEGVGLIEVKGVILDSQETVDQLTEMRKNDSVKSVVLRVDSPGGVVGPSQEIYAEVKKLAGVKKVVVSMGSLAASGGYYISAPASVIMANPGTITGSIGVLMKLSNVEELLGKVGMKAFTLKTGKYKDAGSPLRTLTEEDRAMLQGVIDDAHDQFVRAVAAGRRLPVDQVRQIADGRIFTGEQALALKLIDRTGTLQDAIEEAGRLGRIKGEPRLIRPSEKAIDWLDLFVEKTSSRLSGMLKRDEGMTLRYEME